MTAKKVILAYSGGLDTSCILKWLLEQGNEVICYMADVGQDEDFEVAKLKAIKIGAKEVIVEDLKNDFITNYVWPAVQMGLIYEGRYLLGTSLARPCISVGLVNAAKLLGATHIAHGATGKGNDQVRFELSCYALWPQTQIIAPWRESAFTDRFAGRGDLIKYATQHGIPVSVTPKAPWSTDANIMHISYESGVLEDPAHIAPADLYQMTRSPISAPDRSSRIDIYFDKGLPTRVVDLDNQKTYTEPVDMLIFLNKIGGENGVGRIDIVENRFIGLKSRGVYETPGCTILYAAHHDLEVFCLDREVARVNVQLQLKMAECVYNGLWFSPEATFVRSCIERAEQSVNGRVTVEIYKGHVLAIARESPSSLYNQSLVSMEEHGTLSPRAATGFIEVQAVRLKEHYRVNEHA